MIHFISYSVREALVGIKANKEGYLITIVTTGISMAIFGVFLIVFFNLNEMVQQWREKFQIIVYLTDDSAQQDMRNVKSYFASRQEIEEYSYISKEKALVSFRKRLNNNETIMDNLDVNPLPASFELKLKKNFRQYDKIKSLALEINKLKGVESLEFGEGWLERFETILFFFKCTVFAIGGFICIGIIFIVSNTIKLSLYARKDEIEIMQLVGATDWFIRGPFLLEGMLQGLLGVVLSMAILYGLHQVFIVNLQTSSFFIGQHSFLFLPPMVINYLILVGMLTGCVGSFISVGKFLIY